MHHMNPLRYVSIFVGLCLLVLSSQFVACGGEVSVSFPGCEQCPERCLREGNSGKCVDCIKDEQCQSSTSPTKKCLDNRCYCGTNKDCPGDRVCDGKKGCVECKANSDCKDSEKAVCLERTCVACNPGESRACAPDGLEVCVKGTQTCKGSGSWGPCENAVSCQKGERCLNSKCLPACPDPAVCKKDEKQCTTASNVYPGKYKECKLNDIQCYEFATEEKFCDAKEVCDKGACVPFTCPDAECKEGETRCVDDDTQQTCGRDKDNCIVWLPSKACQKGEKCYKSANQCTLCEPKAVRKCYEGDAKTKNQGECKEGTQACKEDGSAWGPCVNQVLPKTDLCNGKDDDCDGTVDEDFAKLGTECTVGKGLCANTGKFVCTSDAKAVECNVKPKSAAKELCNGKDDNCDGNIDESFPDLNKKCKSGKGICEAEGKFICKLDGSDVVCDAKVGTPTTETCNGKDDNCDGQVDEKLTRPCYTGKTGCELLTGTNFYRCKGICNFGVQNCAGGQWTACAKEVLPLAKELCNGKDDNCDGSVDEGNPTGGGDCIVKNTYALCAKGKFACVNGAQACKQINLPKTELCNGKDDDCDGKIDNSIPVLTYYPDTDKDKYGDANATGKTTCAALAPAGWVPNKKDCNDKDKAINPDAKDVCDGKDNNCDKQVDEGNAIYSYYPDADKDGYGNSQATVKKTCEALAPAGWVKNNTDCNDNNKAINPKATDVCDGVDNNCDKRIDEGNAVYTYYPDNDKDGFGNSQSNGTTRCAGLKPAGWVTNKTDCNDNSGAIKPTAQEVCDGVDNNCNSQVDEGHTRRNYYRDSDGDSYGAKTLIFTGCLKNSTTVCTGLNSCRTKSGYVTNNTDCCDTDNRAKPGQTSYYSSANKCGSFDYNCDSKTTPPSYGTCTCSRTTKYYRSGYADTWIDGGSWQRWYTAPAYNNTYNSASCLLDLSTSLAAGGTKRRQCGPHKYCIEKAWPVCIKERTCTAPCDIQGTWTKRTWTPRPRSGRYIMWLRSKYRSGCAYRTDGNTPKCGDSVQRAGNLLSGLSSNPKGEANAGKTGSCDGRCNKQCKYRIDWKFSADNKTYGYTNPASSFTLPCH